MPNTLKPKWLAALQNPMRLRVGKLNKRLRLCMHRNKMLKARNRWLRQRLTNIQNLATDTLSQDQLRKESCELELDQLNIEVQSDISSDLEVQSVQQEAQAERLSVDSHVKGDTMASTVRSRGRWWWQKRRSA